MTTPKALVLFFVASAAFLSVITPSVYGIVSQSKAQQFTAEESQSFDAVWQAEFTIIPDPLNDDTPETFRVKVHPEWAPLGAARFKELVMNGFYDDSRFFRVIPDFMVQFGLSGKNPKDNESKYGDLRDDPHLESISNKRGMVTFANAGPNTRTTQLFINYKDNHFLDNQHFEPFAYVDEDSMKVVDKIYKIGERPDQGKVSDEGNSYMMQNFPEAGKLVSVKMLGVEGAAVEEKPACSGSHCSAEDR